MNTTILTRIFAVTIFAVLWHGESLGETWQRHTVDASLQGADGVRLADFNADGLMDIVTGWEESGIVRLYLHPGYAHVKNIWPSVTVAMAASPEDAFPFDANRDGILEIISCHEGKQKQVFVHTCSAGDSNEQLLNASNWNSTPLTSLDGQRWMYATDIEMRDGRRGLVLGSKDSNGSITLLVPPPEASRPIEAWQAHKLRDAGWVMTIESIDMDQDGDDDIVLNDRKGKKCGIVWLEQPDTQPTSHWPEHRIGAQNRETLFMEVSPDRVLASTRESVWIELVRAGDRQWSETVHDNPPSIPFCKSISQLGDNVFVMTANTAADKIQSDRPGIWIKTDGQAWKPMDSTPATKFDQIKLIDLDGDSDLDVLTCEERKNLGVVWFENPTVTSK